MAFTLLVNKFKTWLQIDLRDYSSLVLLSFTSSTSLSGFPSARLYLKITCFADILYPVYRLMKSVK